MSKKTKYDEGTNFVAGGVEANPYLFALLIAAPFLSLLLAYVTSPEMAAVNGDLATRPVSGMLVNCVGDPLGCVSGVVNAGLSVVPTFEAAKFVLGFMAVALALERILPGKIETGPETLTGHVPKYVDNGLLHCGVFTVLFWTGSNLGPLGLYDFGIIYDLFPGSVAFLNIFGMIFCVFLTFKGLKFPSTQVCSLWCERSRSMVQIVTLKLDLHRTRTGSPHASLADSVIFCL